MNSSSSALFSSFLQPLQRLCTRRYKGAPTASSTTGAKPSKRFAKAPVVYFRLSCLALCVAALLSLRQESGGLSAEAKGLLLAGWELSGPIQCGPLLPGHYYELSNEDSSLEIFVDQETILSASQASLEPPYECRKIPKPNNVQEI